MNKDNKYTKMQKQFYESTSANMAKVNHRNHDINPDYWNILLQPVREDSAYWKNKKALDFGCGTGRNICNLSRMTFWKRVDGVDISENNLKEADRILKREGVDPKNYKLFMNNGVDLSCIEDEQYDFVMSTIVLQHIAVYDIRFSLLSEIFRILKPFSSSGSTFRESIFSFQMGFGEGRGKAEYHENAYDAKGTNSKHDVIVRDPKQIIDDLQKIGFYGITYVIRPAFSDGHSSWIFFTACK